MTLLTYITLATFFLCLLIYFSQKEIIRFLKAKKNFSDFSEGEKFAIWSKVESAWLDELVVGYVDDWECGHNFTITCQVTSSEPIGIKGGSISVSAAAGALSHTKVIGRGKRTDDYVNIGISLEPGNAKSLLEEITKSPHGYIHMHGKVTKNEMIYITYLSFSPDLDG